LATTLQTAAMGFFDLMLLKSDLAKQGVDKGELFSDPETYLAATPLKFTSVRPWPMALFYFVTLSTLPYLLVTYVNLPFSEVVTLIVPMVGWGLGILALVVLMFLLPKQEMTVDAKGITIQQGQRTLHAPWKFFNTQGQSGLKSPTVVKIPVSLDFVEDVTATDGRGNTKSGEEINVNFFRWNLGRERVQISNLYPLTGTDLAEMIRRIALTIGHQQPAE
jgi:hypothetical protein